MIVLGNTDAYFDDMPAPQPEFQLDAYWREAARAGLHDLVVTASGDLYGMMGWLSSVPGMISSRTLILSGQHALWHPVQQGQEGKRGKRRQSKQSQQSPQSNPSTPEVPGLLLLDSMVGQEEEVLQALSGIEEITALYTSRGVYGIAAAVSYRDERAFRQTVNVISGIRHAALLPLSSPLPSISVVHDPQAITSQHYNSRNKNEREYQHDQAINESYADGCMALAHLLPLAGEFDEPSMVYAPIRGAKPITDGVMEAYRRLQRARGDAIDVFSPAIQYPVTSSFVSYTEGHPYQTKRGRMPASGRTTNRLELQRLQQHHADGGADLPSCLVYIDEIISGGMMVGHVREMVDQSEGILYDIVRAGELAVKVCGLSHARGASFRMSNRQRLSSLQDQGLISFSYAPVQSVVTEDRRALLGLHYIKNELGPHSIPFIDEGREYRPEQKRFWGDVVKRLDGHI